MNKYTYILFLFIGLGFLGFLCFYIFLNNSGEGLIFKKINPSYEKTLLIGNTSIPVDVARTANQRIRGLSGKEHLDKKAGLLFVFEEPDTHGFWMKDMNFPIDIIWIDKEWTIVDITEKISPETFPEIFKSKTPVQYVLEVNANFVNENNISIGDVVFEI